MLLAADSLFLFASCNNSSSNAYQIIKKYYFRLVVFWCYIFFSIFFSAHNQISAVFCSHTPTVVLCLWSLLFIRVSVCLAICNAFLYNRSSSKEKTVFWEFGLVFLVKRSLLLFYMYVICILTYKYFFMMCYVYDDLSFCSLYTIYTIYFFTMYVIFFCVGRYY